MDARDTICLFARGKWDIIKTQAENAWLEGKDAKDNPYDSKVFLLEHQTWYYKWLECNKNC